MASPCMTRPHRLRASCAPELEAARAMLAGILGWAAPRLLLFSPEEAAVLRLVLHELVANAVEHGSGGSARTKIVVRLGILPQKGFVVLVGDTRGQAVSFDADGAAEGDVCLERGRGITILQALSSRLSFRVSTGMVSARRDFAG